MKLYMLAFGVFLFGSAVHADNNRQEWLNINGDVKLDDNDNLNATAVFRSRPDSFDVGQRLLRIGITHKIGGGKSVAIAYTHVTGFVAGGPNAVQHRGSESFTMPLAAWSEGKLDGRFQAEEILADGSNDVGIRLRPRVRLVQNLGARKNAELQLSDELIWSINNTDFGQASGFTANRAGAAIRFAVDKHFGVAPGYTWQLVNRTVGPNRNDHILGLTLDARF